MPKIVLAVGKGFSGEIIRYEIDDEVMVGEMIRKFFEEIYRYEVNTDDFVLFNLTRGFEYKNDETFASRETKNGDIVLLINLKEL